MTATNGWPGKPGVPLNPEQDGWHWVKTGHGVAPWLWRDDPQALTWGMGWEINEEVLAPDDIARVPGTTYLGPVLTPDEATAMQKRVAELEDFCEDYLVRFELFHITNTLEAPEDATGFLAEKARAILGAAKEGGKDE